MVVGSGMMAQAFASFAGDAGVLVFASGVSDSMETSEVAFSRERELLKTTLSAHPESMLLFFGTCSVYDPDRCDTPYVRHKLAMEDILAAAPNPWMILRLPLAIGPGHRGNTLARFLYERIRRDEPFDVWERATRYPIDVADVFTIARSLLEDRTMRGRRINVALRAYRILDFVEILERMLNKRARYTLLPKGLHYDVECPEVSRLAPALGLAADEGYLERVLRRYFSARR